MPRSKAAEQLNANAKAKLVPTDEQRAAAAALAAADAAEAFATVDPTPHEDDVVDFWVGGWKLAGPSAAAVALLERLAADPDPLVAEAAQRARTFRKL